MKHVPTTHGTAEVDDMDDRCSDTQVGRRASREGHVHKPFIRSCKPSPRQRQEPTGSGAAWSLTFEASAPMAAFCSARLASFPRASCRIIAAIDGYISTRMPTCVLDHHYRLVLASPTSRNTTQAAGSRVAV